METGVSCRQFGRCGGCAYLDVPYEEELSLKEDHVYGSLKAGLSGYEGEWLWEGITASPVPLGYRNKMEFTFGDERKGGPLTLGQHRRRSWHDVLDADECKICDSDFTDILMAVRDLAVSFGMQKYDRRSHTGYLRHLIIRKAYYTGEIMVCLVTTSEAGHDLSVFTDILNRLSLKGTLTGFLHIVNDSLADAVKEDSRELLYGRDYITERICGLDFKITPFSFFQANSPAASLIYERAAEYVAGAKPSVVYDLYSGTGTIGQIMSRSAEKVYGIELVPEAVEAATENARLNGIENCHFICGDVLEKIHELKDRPDVIVLDPPRNGVHPKALPILLSMGAPYILCIACKVESLQRDLPMFLEHGYRPVKASCFDLFPKTQNIESCVLLERVSNRKADSYVKLNVKMADYYRIKDSAETENAEE